jgi:diacylglycerol kinase family enzyme
LAGQDADYRSTEERDWIEALSARPDLLAVAGGDGTVTEVFIADGQRDAPRTYIEARLDGAKAELPAFTHTAATS